MNFGAIFDKARGIAGAAQLAKMFQAAKLNAKFEPVPFPGRQAAFQRASIVAARPDAEVFAITGADKDGSQIEALLVFSKKVS
jgi:hypothetical protein